MDLPTYTNIWRIEKRLYKLYDFRLPMPLPVGTFGVALGIFALWVVLLTLLRAPFEFGNGWHLVMWVVPPGVITVLATRPVIEGKRLTELLISQARFLAEARVYTRMAPEYEPAQVRVAVRVWHRDPAAGPLPLPRSGRRARTEEEAAALAEHEASVEEAPVPEISEEERALRAAREAAPPLRGVPTPEPAASRAAPEPEPVDDSVEYIPAPEVEAPEVEPHKADAAQIAVRKIPVTVGAGAQAVEREDDAPAAMTTTRPPGQDEEEERPRHGVGRRMLNYFGFGLPAHDDGAGAAPPDEEHRALSNAGAEEDEVDFDEPLYATEEDEQRDRDEWFARLKASSGETPVGLTSKSAYASSDTGAMSSEELGDAVSPAPSSRRLRGRTQGIQVARDLDARREREGEPTDITEHAEVSDAPERARERMRPPAEPEKARGRALPATDTERAPERKEAPRRKGRPHASPWELEKKERRGEYPDLSDYAARYAEATGRPSAARDVAPAPWLPPASGAPGKTEDKSTEDTTTEDKIEEKPETEPEPETSPEDVGTPDRIGRTEVGPQVSHAARPRPQAPELDHGTGEQDNHMSVLDRHLIKADTPAPPRPKFADAVPADERPVEPTDPSEWFDDGKRRHPDQPKVGDKDNPVIPVSELREERRKRERDEEEEARARRAEEAAEVEPTKPATQLDHGTGELVSFVEVREEPKPVPEPKPRARRPDPEPRPEPKPRPEPEPVRPTEAELAEAEAAALRARRRDKAEERSEEPAGTRAGTRAEEQTEQPAEEWFETGHEPREAHDPHDPHDGVFHRVANNARRIGRLFGQPPPGEEPEPPAPRPAATEPEPEPEPAKPGLELDHGTGEQDRLTEPAPTTEEPEADSGGTRGWRRLAKVVTGGGAPIRSDLPAADVERLRAPLAEPRSLVVLGCTGGAGQTMTALMVGHTLAVHRDDRVVAVDVNPGANGLSRRVGAQAPETLTALLANADAIDEYESMRAYAGRARTGLEVVQTLDDPYVQTLDDRDYGQLTDLLGSFYGITLLDPAATGVARALPVADGLVLVAPASADAERAVSMTFEWLDGNGYSALRANSVLVVNGVSKRSLPDVDAAERVARGRCRAIVRIPWDDHLGASYTKIDVGSLKPATKRAHGALAGVLVNALEPAGRS
ncbi:TcpE family conjugal transfer membrane protein [Nocardiopsis sp. NPDC006832]|uniref:TcpE family conjugal transfer membrane protein n=1 Tax=Nocardiopsis sp. NPDC006832 TaxID=3157188 RepID=UPI0033F5712A